MMHLGLIYDDRFLEHDTGPGHPERRDRLRAITARLKKTGQWDALERLPFGPADRAWIERLHRPAYIERCFAACAAGQRFIDSPDSAISARSAELAQLAVGGVLAAAEAVMTGRVARAFCAVRPPGHHAEADLSMGFCLFNNVAIAAEYLIVQHGLERVAIVDFDVHHGNGTQHLFEDRRDVLFVSLHQDPHTLYPGTGFADEAGVGDGQGFTLNVPLPPLSDDHAYLDAIDRQILPRLRTYEPEALLVSAGFDAATADPLAQMEVSTDGFTQITRRLIELADERCAGRLLSVLEGGYDLDALAEGVSAHVAELGVARKNP